MCLVALAGLSLWIADTVIRNRYHAYNHCMAVSIHIESAKEQIALRDNLHVGDPVRRDDVASFGHISMLRCYSSGTISVGRIGEESSCSIHGSFTNPNRVRLSLFRK